MTPHIISILRKIGIYIDSEVLFVKKDENSNEHFVFKFSVYYPIYEAILNYDIIQDLPEYNSILEKKKDIQNFAKEEKEVVFAMNLKDEYSYNSIRLQVFSIRELSKKNDKRQKSLKVKENEEDSENISYELSGERENEFNNQSINAAANSDASSVSSTSYKDPSQGIGSNKGKQNDKNYERIKSLSTINIFTLIILIFDIFLIILSIIFLILEVKENIYFKKVFGIFQTFKVFKRGIQSSPLCLVPNYQYILEYENNMVKSTINIFKTYSNQINQAYISMQNLPSIDELILKEMSYKHKSINDNFNDYLSDLFKITNTNMERIQNLLSFSFSLQKEDTITLSTSYLNFISLIREYNNYLSNLLINDLYLSQNISIFSMEQITNLNFVIKPQYEFELTALVKNMLLLIFSYPSVHVGLAESSYFLQQEFYSSKNTMESLLYIFFFLFISLHVILIMIVILFFIIYLRLLKINIYSANKLFTDKKYIQFLIKRLELIKIINTLYSVNPIVLFDKIKMLEEDYKSKAHQ